MVPILNLYKNPPVLSCAVFTIIFFSYFHFLFDCVSKKDHHPYLSLLQTLYNLRLSDRKPLKYVFTLFNPVLKFGFTVFLLIMLLWLSNPFNVPFASFPLPFNRTYITSNHFYFFLTSPFLCLNTTSRSTRIS